MTTSTTSSIGRGTPPGERRPGSPASPSSPCSSSAARRTSSPARSTSRSATSRRSSRSRCWSHRRSPGTSPGDCAARSPDGRPRSAPSAPASWSVTGVAATTAVTRNPRPTGRAGTRGVHVMIGAGILAATPSAHRAGRGHRPDLEWLPVHRHRRHRPRRRSDAVRDDPPPTPRRLPCPGRCTSTSLSRSSTRSCRCSS